MLHVAAPCRPEFPGAVRELHAANPRHKPLALLLYGDAAAHRTQVAELDREPDVACYDTMDEAIMGLAATWRYRQFLEAPAPRRFELPRPRLRSPRAPAAGGGAGGGGGPEDPEGLRFAPGSRGPGRGTLRRPRPPGHGEVGYPVVLKIISPEWLHKSDWGACASMCHRGANCRQAYQELTALFTDTHPRREPRKASWCRSRCRGSSCSWG